MLIILFLAALWAGAQNALAGGGSFITLPALILSGLDARAANIASTLALFPGQVTTGYFGRKLVQGVGTVSFRTLVLISLAGGVVGACLLLLTPSHFFAKMLPWLVLLATGLFAIGSFGPKQKEGGARIGAQGAMAAQFGIAIYGGYFGGGIGFLMLAALTMAGLAVRAAGSTKNALAAAMNAAAVAVFAFTPGIPWDRVAVVAAGAIAGGYLGALMLRHVDEKLIRIAVVIIGLCLTVGLFLRGA